MDGMGVTVSSYLQRPVSLGLKRNTMCIHEHHLHQALHNLYDLDLVAYKPFSRYASDGFHQVLSLPQDGPPNP